MRILSCILIIAVLGVWQIEAAAKTYLWHNIPLWIPQKASDSLYESKKAYLSEEDHYPSHLLYYVHYRMGLIKNWLIMSDFKHQIPIKGYVKNFFQEIHHFETISNLFTPNRMPFDFDFDIKYKKIKETKGERPHPLLNYIAREAEIAEGFEAGETLFGAYQLMRGVKLISHIALFEKWMIERKQYQEVYHLEEMVEQIEADERKITGTIKYGVGWLWDIEMRNRRKMSIEFMMQQKTYNQWAVKEQLMPTSKSSGVVFDHWVMTFTFEF